jgi:hypothetical protein
MNKKIVFKDVKSSYIINTSCNKDNDCSYLKTKHYFFDRYNNNIKVVTISDDNFYEEYYYKNNKLDRLNRPAFYYKIFYDQTIYKYYRNGKLHNLYDFAVMVHQDYFEEYNQYSIENKYYIDDHQYKNKNEFLLKIQNHKNNIKSILNINKLYNKNKDINDLILNYYI